MAYTGKKPIDHTDVTQSQSMTVTDDLTVDTDTLVVDSTNNRVGIGTASPNTLTTLSATSGNAILELNRANANTTGAVGAVNFTVSDGHSVANMYAQGDGDNEGAHLVFRTTSAAGENDPYGSNTTERMRIDSSGKVGIGEDVPLKELSVVGTVRVQNADGDTNGLNISSDANGDAFIDAGYSVSDLKFGINGTERVRIDSSGNVQIATTSTPSTSVFGYRLAATGLFKSSRDAGGSGASMQVFGNAGEARIMGDGDLLNTNNSYGQISDETLKQDIADAASQWADIKALKVRKFRFKDNPTGTLQIGVIAQELEASGMNGLVKQIDLNQDEDSEETIKAVKYSVLHMKAVKALQEAMERIEALETKVAALEAE